MKTPRDVLFVILVMAPLLAECSGGLASIDPPGSHEEDVTLPPVRSIVGDLVDPWNVSSSTGQPVPGQLQAPDIVNEEPEYFVSEDGSFQVVVHTNGPVDAITVWGRSESGDDVHAWEITNTGPGDPNLNPSYHVLRIPVGHRPPDSMTVSIGYRKGLQFSAFKVITVKYGPPTVSSTFQLQPNPTRLGGQFRSAGPVCAGVSDFITKYTLSQSGSTLTLTDDATGVSSSGFVASNGEYDLHSANSQLRVSGTMDDSGRGPVALWRTTPSRCTAELQGQVVDTSVTPFVSLTLFPDTVVVAQGSSGQVYATAHSSFLGAARVSLTVSGVPATVQASFDRDSLPPNVLVTANLTLQVDTSTPRGDYPMYVGADFGWAEDIESFVLRVVAQQPNLAITVQPAGTTVDQGTTAYTTDIRVPIHVVHTGFSGAVVVDASSRYNGVSVTPASISLAPGVSDSAFTVNVSAGSVGVDTIPITVYGSGPLGLDSANASFTVTVQPYGGAFDVALTLVNNGGGLDAVFNMTTVTQVTVTMQPDSTFLLSGTPSPPWSTLPITFINTNGYYVGDLVQPFQGQSADYQTSGQLANDVIDFSLSVRYPWPIGPTVNYHGHGIRH